MLAQILRSMASVASKAFILKRMINRTREKIALVILCLLLVFGGIALVSYIIAGHSLNVTATQIDDAVGTMEGYTAIVFEGTIDSDERREAFAQAHPTSEAEGENVDEAAGEGETEGEDVEEAAVDEVAAEGAADGFESPSEDASAQEVVKTAPVLAEVCDDYRSKGADVFTLDIANPLKYRDGLILKQGDHRIGVFSIEGVTTTAEVEEMLAYFELNKVEIVVAIAPLASFLATTEGIDIIVTTSNAAGSLMGGVVDGSYVVQAPTLDSVGVVFISPGNVVSSKVITES